MTDEQRERELRNYYRLYPNGEVTWLLAQLDAARQQISENVTDAIHPDFGWIWREDEIGGQLRLRAEAAEQREEQLRKALTQCRTQAWSAQLGNPVDLNAITNIADAALADGA